MELLRQLFVGSLKELALPHVVTCRNGIVKFTYLSKLPKFQIEALESYLKGFGLCLDTFDLEGINLKEISPYCLGAVCDEIKSIVNISEYSNECFLFYEASYWGKFEPNETSQLQYLLNVLHRLALSKPDSIIGSLKLDLEAKVFKCVRYGYATTLAIYGFEFVDDGFSHDFLNDLLEVEGAIHLVDNVYFYSKLGILAAFNQSTTAFCVRTNLTKSFADFVVDNGISFLNVITKGKKIGQPVDEVEAYLYFKQAVRKVCWITQTNLEVEPVQERSFIDKNLKSFEFTNYLSSCDDPISLLSLAAEIKDFNENSRVFRQLNYKD